MVEIGTKRKKVLFFYNPNAGNSVFKSYLDFVIERYQEKDLQVVPVRASRGHVIFQAMAELNPEEYHQIAVAGGDGTINICVTAMINNNIDLPLAIYPTGTANDFAYYFDLPKELDQIIDIATGDNLTYADVGVCNGRYFINVAAIGTLVDISQKTDPNLKNTLGVFSYYLRGVTELANLRPIPVTLTTDQQVYEENMYFMLVMNGKSAGGFKKISPESEINDGKLDVILFREMPKYELGHLFVNVVQGAHPDNKNVLYFQTDNLKIESPEDIATDVDGECGEPLPLEFSLLHKRLKIYVGE